MGFRRVIFWTHLSVGVAAGIVILLMSLTGVLLTYQRQIEAWATPRVMADGRAPLGADALVPHALAAAGAGSGAGLALRFEKDPTMPVSVLQGRRPLALLDPATGAVLTPGAGAEAVRTFLRGMVALHRWLALEGDSRPVGRALTGAANLGFLFLVVSGLYLWWPRSWTGRVLRTKLMLRRMPSARARDFHWHNVFGIWALVPLFVVVLSGVVLSYDWATALVYQSVGESPPQGGGHGAGGGHGNGQGGGGRGGGSGAGQALHAGAGGNATLPPLQPVLARAQALDPDWRRITLPLAGAGQSDALEVTVDSGNGAQIGAQQTARFSRADGRFLSAAPATEGMTAGRRAWIFLRFVHTGEVFGVIGQTVAGLVSAVGVLLVYTGLALAWRRLIVPLFRKTAEG